ncbi:oligopeptidase B [Undibacterium sp. GrIS 1.8]|uniref:S9 family peptidase n=1 Tax=Undibacterium sp. GrIS 1.8 TaxID=3143934 RepID=UPI00339B0F35
MRRFASRRLVFRGLVSRCFAPMYYHAAAVSLSAFVLMPVSFATTPAPAAPPSVSLTPSTMQTTTPPVAAQRPYQVESPNGSRNDPYYWIRDDKRESPDMLAYLAAENAYFTSQSAAYQGLTEKLYQEIVGRIKQDDSTVPFKKGHYQYYTRFAKGGEYPLFARKPAAGGTEQIMIDGNLEAEKKSYFDIGQRAVSSNEQLLAYLEDDSGRRQYTLKFIDLKTGKKLPDQITGLAPQVAWAADNKTVFYIENDPVTLLTTRVKKHVLGTDVSKDVVVYTEEDHSYYMGIGSTGDDRYIAIELRSTETTETRIIDAKNPDAAPVVMAARSAGVKYNADHINGRWIISTDWQAPNYRLMSVADDQIGDRSKWQELVPHNKAVFIQNFALFKNYIAINERSEGLLRIRIMPWSASGKSTFIKSDEPAYAESFGINAEQNTDELRYSYSSLTTPASVYAVNMKTGVRKLLKEQPVLGGFKKSDYVTERVWAPAKDGTSIPVSLVYRKGFKKDGTAPLYQYAYGSYGASTDPVFRPGVISLLDRGFVYAIAHIRGGQEMGRDWYENGKLLKKKNTFTDFIDVTDYLVSQHYAAKDKVFAMGGSAGGLLMGAVANLAGEKYAGMIAHVPFVDVVTTMLDESIPLTTNEFDEWGNPKQKASYDYMLSYSPYDNIAHKNYPPLLVTTGLYDSQVQYYEPTKWVAKLRAAKTDQNPLLFKVNMEAGHGGKSGRFVRQHETAEEYGFVLHQLGISQ